MKDSKTYLVLLGIFLYMYTCNSLVALSSGDDYVYSFIWQDWNIYIPIPNDAQRIASFSDLFASQWSHYFTWGGRSVAHFMAQFFLWQGKPMFNIVNAGMVILLIIEIYWLTDGGRIQFHFSAKRTIWIFFFVWTFVLGFGGVFFWVMGACNYLWTSVILLAFLNIYVRDYFCETDKIQSKFNAWCLIIFCLGVLAGWTNENTVCWWLLIGMGYILYIKKKYLVYPFKLIFGWCGLMLGYIFLIAAPGNYIRSAYELSHGAKTGIDALQQDAIMLFFVFLGEFLLWFFSVNTMRHYKLFGRENIVVKYMNLIYVFAFLSLSSLFIMLLSPAFPIRAAFPSALYLIIVVVLIIRLQDITRKNKMKKSARKFLCIIGGAYLIVSMTCTLYGYCLYWQQDLRNQCKLEAAIQVNDKDAEFVLQQPTIPKWIHAITFWHIIHAEFETDPEDWKNVAYARYYKIKAIWVETKETNE